MAEDSAALDVDLDDVLTLAAALQQQRLDARGSETGTAAATSSPQNVQQVLALDDALDAAVAGESLQPAQVQNFEQVLAAESDSRSAANAFADGVVENKDDDDFSMGRTGVAGNALDVSESAPEFDDEVDDLMGSLAKDMQFIAEGNLREQQKAESHRSQRELATRTVADLSAEMLEMPLISIPFEPAELQQFTQSWLAELGTSEYDEPSLRIPYGGIFSEKFATERHRLFIAVRRIEPAAPTDDPPEAEYRIVCTSRVPRYNNYSGAVIHGEGYNEFSVPIERLEHLESASQIEKAVARVAGLGDGFRIRMVADDRLAEFGAALTAWEQQHRIGHRAVKLAVIFSKEDQITAPEMFANTQADHTPAFEVFLNALGSRIKLDNWDGYRGDVKDQEGQSYWNRWLPAGKNADKTIDIMFHVSTLMNAEMHRRLIGNDVAVILFRQSTVPINPMELDLGRVPQIFAVVQPVGFGNDGKEAGLDDSRSVRFRVMCYQRATVQRFLPAVPLFHIFDPNELREFLLTKMVNGYNVALMSPPFSRLTTVPRTAAMPGLCKPFVPKDKSKFQGFGMASSQKISKAAKKAHSVAAERAAELKAETANRRASMQFRRTPWSRGKDKTDEGDFQQSALNS